MKEKLLNIKNILRIIISVLIIFSMLKSCSKAYTWDEFVGFLETYKDSYNEQNMCTAINLVLPHIDTAKTKFTSAGYDLSNYKSFYCTAFKVDYTYSVLFYAYEYDDVDWSCLQNNQIQFNTTNKYEVMVRFNYGTKYDPTSYGFQNPNRQIRQNGTVNHLTGLFNKEARNGVYYDTTYVNQYYDTTNIYFGHLFSNTITYNSEEMEANELDYNYRIEFVENVITEDNEIASMQATLDSLTLECQNLGSYWTLKCNNSTLLKYNQIYTLNVTAIVNGNEEEIEEKILFIPPGTTINGGVITFIPSGDYNFNTENATNQIIDNQNQNNTFWQDTYNNLFVMDSGDVNRLIANMKENIKIDNFGDVSGEIAILNTLTGEPSDFIIAWNQTQYMGKTIIPSGEINFSQKVREVPALKTTQDWLRIIMGYSITIVLMSEIFFTILRCLGVGVSIYEQHNEEIERLEEMHTPKIYETEVMTPKGIKRYRSRRTRIQ